MPASAPGESGPIGVVATQSHRVQRVTHSSFDSESINAVTQEDLAININETSTEFLHGVCPGRRQREARQKWMSARTANELHTDAMSLVKLMKVDSTSVLTRRRARDIADLRECIQEEDLTAVLHIAGPTNPADCGTKARDRSKDSIIHLKKVLQGNYSPDITPLEITEQSLKAKLPTK